MITAALALGGGCSFKDRTYTPSEAEKKLVLFCKKEGELPVYTRRLGKTLWIYTALKEPLFTMRSSPDREDPKRKVQPLALLSIQAEYSQRYFKFNYDIVPDVLAGEPVSYGSGYNELYTKKRQLIYQAIQESFFNAASKTNDLMPEFVVVMVADINTGIATRTTFYLRDLKQSLTEAIPPEEYYMRELNEIIGKQGLIQDPTGRNAPYVEITWPYFLTEQIKNRIKFKFTGSDFPPDSAPTKEIAKIAANTLRFYPFADYDGVVLYDVRGKKEQVLGKDGLKTYAEKTSWEDSKGKLTTIRFEIPKDPTSGVIVSTTNSMVLEDQGLPE